MSDLLKLFIVGVYIFLVYKYHKNTVLLLLFTLATILILCNINKKLRVKPWSISFSYGRALQKSALRIWKGDDNNMNNARDKLLERSRANSLAVLGIESL